MTAVQAVAGPRRIGSASSRGAGGLPARVVVRLLRSQAVYPTLLGEAGLHRLRDKFAAQVGSTRLQGPLPRGRLASGTRGDEGNHAQVFLGKEGLQ